MDIIDYSCLKIKKNDLNCGKYMTNVSFHLYDLCEHMFDQSKQQIFGLELKALYNLAFNTLLDLLPKSVINS